MKKKYFNIVTRSTVSYMFTYNLLQTKHAVAELFETNTFKVKKENQGTRSEAKLKSYLHIKINKSPEKK